MNVKRAFVIIPVFNDTAVIRHVVEQVIRLGHTVVVVDDGSEEAILPALDKLCVYYIRHRFNLGQGAALQTGITFGLSKGAEFFVTFDADGQHDPSDIAPLMLELSDRNLDIVFGSRFLGLKPSKLPFIRKIILNVARFLNYLFSGILLSDAHNGLRVFNKKAAMSLHLIENRMAHATEFLITVKKKQLKYGEYPVHVSYTAYSRKKGQKTSYSFKVLQDILLHKIFK